MMLQQKTISFFVRFFGCWRPKRTKKNTLDPFVCTIVGYLKEQYAWPVTVFCWKICIEDMLAVLLCYLCNLKKSLLINMFFMSILNIQQDFLYFGGYQVVKQVCLPND